MPHRRRLLAIAAGLVAVSVSGSFGPSPAAAANDAPSVTWDDSTTFSSWVRDVYADPAGGWIVAGGSGAWTSADGREWTASTVETYPNDGEFTSHHMNRTARAGDELLNLGERWDFGDSRSIRGWRSGDDGATWATVATDAAIYEDGYLPRDAAGGEGIIVAAEFGFPSHSGRLWRYAGPEAGWTDTTPIDAEGYGHDYRDTLHADETFVVVGTRRDQAGGAASDGTMGAASWTSDDGTTWTTSAPNPALLGSAFTGVAADPGGEGYVAVGYSDAPNGGENGTAQAWTSPDGLNWTEVAGPPASAGVRGVLIVAIDGGFLAAIPANAGDTTQLWTSADGDGWQAAGSLAGAAVDIDTKGSEVVLLTYSGDASNTTTAHHGTVGPPQPFTDIADSPFRDDIEWLAAEGIASGCTADRFCPERTLTRGQMATFLDRSFDFAPTSEDRFTDDDGSTHEDAINRLAVAGVTGGCGPGRFCPNATVTRAQLASFLDRAMDLPPASRDWFTDDTGSTHEDAINRAREAGLTYGCSATRYCPQRPVTREQMAAYLRRALD